MLEVVPHLEGAGVTTTEIQLSKAISDFVGTIRDVLKEVSDIARSISDLSKILNELWRALQNGRDTCRQSLLRPVKSTIRRVYFVHDDIWDLIDEEDEGRNDSLVLTTSQAEKMQVVLHDPDGVSGTVGRLLADWTAPPPETRDNVAEDLPSSLPFGNTRGNNTKKAKSLALPATPSAPTPPPGIRTPGLGPSPILLKSYSQDFGTYLRMWDLWNRKILDHFVACRGVTNNRLAGDGPL
ncbi:hypothetical protein B0H67DRAFT_642421 [Lasiosphaeris hirsuta]|uniref:Uncharacterized protein n=1 Tax=Lasiosphaeris hirsuta TaxID=260670 RepID=A0AA40E5S1_9PEZI|nr:hypothetical protein B0H67DRAFT_642421 [Lasiosphaeris hirsuta]